MLHGNGVNICLFLKRLVVACMIQNVNWVTPNTYVLANFFLNNGFHMF